MAKIPIKKQIDPYKKANLVESFTEDEINELVKCSSDFMYFVTTYCYIQHPTQGKVLFVPYDYQIKMLEAFLLHNNLVYMCGRQLGKSTCASLYILWKLCFFEDQTILVTSNTRDAAIEILDRIKYSYEFLPHFLKPGIVVNNRKNVIFDNQSEVITRATTKNAGRGLSISLLYSDELSSVEPQAKQKDFWTAIRPTLSTGGQCIITSTPISDEDTFAQIWNAANDTFDSYGNEHPQGIGKNGFKAIKYTWRAHPNRDEAWAEMERAAISEDRFLREHECSFISDSDTLINPIKLATLKGREPKYLTGQTRWYQKPIPGKTYLVGLDPSLGTGGDSAAIQVFQVPEMIQIAEWQHNRTDPRGQTKTLLDILKYIDNCVREHEYDEPEIYWSVENNAGGGGDSVNTVIFQTGEEKFPGTYISEPRKTRANGVKARKGFTTTNRTKLLACSKLKSLIERDKMVLNSKPLVSEFKVFVSKGAGYGAKSGEHDDLVMATLLITRMLEVVMKYNEEFEQELSEGLDEDYEEPVGMVVSSYNNPYNYQ